MKKVLDFSIRYDKAGGWMLKLCLLCLVCFGGGNISLQAKTDGNETVKMLEGTSQQQKELLIRGSVKDKDGLPLPGATVQVKGTTQGTTTDADGEYYIMVKNVEKPILVFSFIGMETQEVKFQKGKHRMDVVLEESQQEMQEVVVNGIYTRNIESFTGSVATFKGDDLKLIGPQNVLRSLSALDPSIIITENNIQGSNPNAKMDITINGKMSIVDLEQEYETDPNQPLFILDGFETTLQTISDLNMDRVESISILKDAASTAIYGSKAANGVIVVETKKPQAGKLRVNYNGSLSVAWADLTDYNLMNSAQKLEFEKLSGVYKTTNGNGYVNLDQNGEIIGESMMAEYYDKLRLVKEGYNTYWMNEPLRTAYSHAHNLYIDGGDSAFRYGIGLSYNKNMGVMKNSNRDVLNGNVTLTYRVDNFSFSSQTSIGNTDANNETVAFSRFSQMNPFYEKRTADGQVPKYVYNSSLTGIVYNPLWDFYQNSFNKSNAHSVTENLQVEWRILPQLRLRGNFQYNLNKTVAEVFVSPNETSEVKKEELKKGSYRNSSTNTHSYNGRLNLTYGANFDSHTINVAAGMQFSENNNKAYAFNVEGYQNDKFWNPNFSNGYPEGGRPTSTDTKSRSASYYANINYAYDMRYLLDFNYTTNGASQFGINDPFTTTWSVGLGWNIHNEKWFEGSENFNYLKLRYSYGNPGNQNFDAKLAGSIYKYVTNYANPFGMAAIVGTWGNNNLKWQKTQTHNVGLNAQFFKSRLNFTVDYQYRKNDPMLLRIDLPSSTGATSAPMNIGATKNQSISGSLTAYIFKQRDLNWYISANASHYTTEYYNIGDILQKYNEEGRASQTMLRYYDGASTSALYVVRSAGIDPATGNEIFIKKDGTYTYEWNAEDEVLYGDSTPDVQGSINTSLTWKDFSFGASFSYRMGAETQLSTLLNKVENISTDQLKYNQDVRALTERWQKPGDIAKFKRIDDTMGTKMSSRFIATENTLQCSSINIGYRTTRAKFLKAMGATSFNVTAYMNDIFRISTVKEERGLSYPFQRSFSLSFGIGF
jgi:TonB-linked SusC/RagA family outer membrane protein